MLKTLVVAVACLLGTLASAQPTGDAALDFVFVPRAQAGVRRIEFTLNRAPGERREERLGHSRLVIGPAAHASWIFDRRSARRDQARGREGVGRGLPATCAPRTSNVTVSSAAPCESTSSST